MFVISVSMHIDYYNTDFIEGSRNCQNREDWRMIILIMLNYTPKGRMESDKERNDGDNNNCENTNNNKNIHFLSAYLIH